jgi:hypothetical protein
LIARHDISYFIAGLAAAVSRSVSFYHVISISVIDNRLPKAIPVSIRQLHIETPFTATARPGRCFS